MFISLKSIDAIPGAIVLEACDVRECVKTRSFEQACVQPVNESQRVFDGI